jgi:murein DD-endopeptidase MepM/ murein hydrolase activator NlpD
MNIRLIAFIAVLASLSSLLAAEDRVHVLKKGDTLYGIARSYGVPYEDLIAANGIRDANKIKIGQKIRIPGDKATTKHRVEKGETFYGIAREYGVPLAQLLEANGLDKKSLLKVGDTLLIPPGGSKPSSPATEVKTPPTETAPVAPPLAVSTESSVKAVDPRQTVTKKTDPLVSWPIRAKDVAYMTGKLYGVVLTGEHAEEVRSLSSGTVVSAGPYRGFGRVAIVQTSDGHAYVYGGCERLSVKEGDRIASGAMLGSLGVDALSQRPQLYFLVYKDNVPMDPAIAPRS